MRNSSLVFFLLLIFISTGCTRQADELEKRKAEEKIVDNPQTQPQPPKQTESPQIEFIKINPFEIDLKRVREWEDMFNTDMMEQNYFKEIISKVFGDHDFLFFQNVEVSKRVYNYWDKIFIFTGYARHQGGSEEGLLLINLSNGSVTGGILSDKKIFIYSTETDMEFIPLVVKDKIDEWIRDIKRG